MDLDRSTSVNQFLGARVARCCLTGLADFLYKWVLNQFLNKTFKTVFKQIMFYTESCNIRPIHADTFVFIIIQKLYSIICV